MYIYKTILSLKYSFFI